MASTAASAVLAAARVLYATVQQVKANKRQARLLSERVAAIVDPVRAFSDARLAQPEVKAALAQLLAVIEDASVFVRDFQDTGRLRRIVFRTRHTDRFAELNTRLGHAAQALTLGAVLQMYFASAEDARAETLDRVGDKEVLGVWAIVPRHAGELVGRAAELEWLSARLRPAAPRTAAVCLAVAGLGGTGKSCLALCAAQALADRFSAGWAVDGYSRDKMIAGMRTVASSLALGDVADEQLFTAIRLALSVRERAGWLLIVDNVDEASFAHRLAALELLPNVGGCVLITSRLSDWDRSGWAMLAVQPLQDDAAVALLRGGVNAAVPSVEAAAASSAAANMPPLPAGDVAAMLAISRAVDGLPLALVQSRTYVQRQRIAWSAYAATLAKQAGLPGASPVLVSLQNSVHAAIKEAPREVTALLKIVGVLHPDNIPRRLLVEALWRAVRGPVPPGAVVVHDAEAAEALAGETLGLLADYSILTLTVSGVWIHRVMRDAVRGVVVCDVSIAPAVIETLESMSVTDSVRNQYDPAFGRERKHVEAMLAWVEKEMPDSHELGRMYHVMAAAVVHSAGQFGEVATYSRKSWELLIRWRPLTDTVLLMMLVIACMLDGFAGRVHEAIAVAEVHPGLVPFLRKYGPAMPAVVQGIISYAYGAALMLAHRYQDMHTATRTAMALMTVENGVEPLQLTALLWTHSWALFYVGRREEHYRVISEGLPRVLEAWGELSPSAAYAICSLSAAVGTRGDSQRQIHLAMDSLDMVERLSGRQSADWRFMATYAADALITAGRMAEAAALLEGALDFCLKAPHYGPRHIETGRVLARLSRADGDASGNRLRQRTRAETALAVLLEWVPPSHQEVAWATASLAEALLLWEDGDGVRQGVGEGAEGAMAMLERAYAHVAVALGEDHPETAVMAVRLARWTLDAAHRRALAAAALETFQAAFGDAAAAHPYTVMAGAQLQT